MVTSVGCQKFWSTRIEMYKSRSDDSVFGIRQFSRLVYSCEVSTCEKRKVIEVSCRIENWKIAYGLRTPNSSSNSISFQRWRISARYVPRGCDCVSFDVRDRGGDRDRGWNVEKSSRHSRQSGFRSATGLLRSLRKSSAIIRQIRSPRDYEVIVSNGSFFRDGRMGSYVDIL